MHYKVFFKEWGTREASSYEYSPYAMVDKVESLTWNEVFEAFEAKLSNNWWIPREALHYAERKEQAAKERHEVFQGVAKFMNRQEEKFPEPDGLTCKYFNGMGGGICEKPSELVKKYLKRHEKKHHEPPEPECEHIHTRWRRFIEYPFNTDHYEEVDNEHCPRCGIKLNKEG